MASVLIFGKDGQVGTELQRSLLPLASLHAVNRSQADLGQLEQIHHTLKQVKPKIIVNAAAYTAVDKAETDPERAFCVNAKAVEVMADYAKNHHALLVHYSTDYVFAGDQSQPYQETDQPNPQNVYGHSKLAGETHIRESGCDHLIFRTSWVYAGHGNNFMRTMMRLAQQRDQLTVVDDQFGTPTSAEMLADLTALSIWAHQRSQLESGLYHLTAKDQSSWHGFAQFIVEQMVAQGIPVRVKPEQVLAIPSAQYPTPAKRPAFSYLDSSKIERALAIELPAWPLHAKRAVAQLAQLAHL
ncbi:dTDP-4-dehydrorhamnose reductase [Paenalcaligenes hominis]|uniref:dTDP-4-dehydrorhamnose reductase n=1 Tax=Paenalcaligenes hominis TaxID=643674 RepID=A0A1U9K040_9BURK|nr:dTDP-4-dehydrorhamnose reductase [Paenalcaligenes hominis]AQS51410.1 dTDP-4-dehydrorhamnose reductase [Paenalcaligenes hominis]